MSYLRNQCLANTGFSDQDRCLFRSTVNSHYCAIHLPCHPGIKKDRSETVRLETRRSVPYRIVPHIPVEDSLTEEEINRANLQVKLRLLESRLDDSVDIPSLVGPVYSDVCLSDDPIEPLTSEPIWTEVGGKRQPTGLGLTPQLLFSYYESSGEGSTSLRCLSIFTVRKMIQTGQDVIVNPKTQTSLPEEAVVRARTLCHFYERRLNLFQGSFDSSAIHELYQEWLRVISLQGLRFSADWYLNLDRRRLVKLFRNTKALVVQNSQRLGISDPNKFFVFSKRFEKKSQLRYLYTYLRLWKDLHDGSSKDAHALLGQIMMDALTPLRPKVKEEQL